MAASVFTFGEWLPDQPELGGSSLLEAHNLLPLDSGYGPFHPLDNSMSTVPATTVAGAYIATGATKGSTRVYVYAGLGFYEGGLNAAGFTARGTSSAAPSTVSFTQFDNMVIAAGGNDFRLMRHTIGAASNFATLAASAPYADVVGIVNRFVVAGALYEDEGAGTITARRSNALSWSGIDEPGNWPTPNSATAIAVQSGEQELLERYGPVTGVHGGDQFSIILQHGAVTRMTYAGPPVVFQFDTISNEFGCRFLGGSVKAGAFVYFPSNEGFCRTDGVQIERIGFGKVDKYFNDNPPSNDVLAAFDPINALVYFAYDSNLLIFNVNTKQWTRATQSLKALMTPPGSVGGGLQPEPMYGINGSALGVMGAFAATAGAATLTTCDAQFNPGGRAFLSGVKPNVQSSATAPAVTVRVGARNELNSDPTFTATTTPTTRTGFADFRSDAKYHRAELQIVGEFEKATGCEFRAQASGEA